MVAFIRKILFDAREKQKREGKKPHPASGIVYCQTRAECEHMVNVLTSGKIPAEAYHAGLSNKVFFILTSKSEGVGPSFLELGSINAKGDYLGLSD